MVTLSESRELLLAVALIGGFSGAFLLFNKPIDFNRDKLIPSPTPSQDSRVLGESTRILLVANPVVHIDVPAHNIFAP